MRLITRLFVSNTVCQKISKDSREGEDVRSLSPDDSRGNNSVICVCIVGACIDASGERAGAPIAHQTNDQLLP